MIFNNDLSPERLYAILLFGFIIMVSTVGILSVPDIGVMPFVLSLSIGLVVLLWNGYALGRYSVLVLIGLSVIGITVQSTELLQGDRTGGDILLGIAIIYIWVGGACLVGLLLHREPKSGYPWWRVDRYPGITLVGWPVLGFGAILLTQFMLEEIEYNTLTETIMNWSWEEAGGGAALLLITLSGLLMVLQQEAGRWGMVVVLIGGWLLSVLLPIFRWVQAGDSPDAKAIIMGIFILMGLALFCAATILQLFNVRAMASPFSEQGIASLDDEVLDGDLM